MRRFTFSLTHLLGTVCVSVLSTSCSAVDPDGELEDVAETQAEVAVKGSSVNGFIPFSTSQGSAVNMTTISNSVCFLTAVKGIFDAYSDRVEIVQNHTVSPPRWQLRKSTSTAGGEAYCGEGITINPPPSADMNGMGTWDARLQDQDHPRDLGTATNRTCFLTAVWGNMKATGEEIKTQVAGSNWQIVGNSAAGSATCVARPSSFPVDLPPSGGGSNFGDGLFTGPLNNTTANSPWLCALTRVSGTFRQNGSVVMRQFLTGGSNQRFTFNIRTTDSLVVPFPPQFRPVTGSGRCFFN